LWRSHPLDVNGFHPSTLSGNVAMTTSSSPCIRPCQHFDWMQYFDSEPVLRHPLAELQDATGIPRDDELRLHARQMCHFTVEEALRRLGVEEIVDPGTAAAPVAFGDLKQLQLWNLA